MNQAHYPDLARCKKLKQVTKINNRGLYWYKGEIITSQELDDMAENIIGCRDVAIPIWTVMEMLDVIPNWLQIRNDDRMFKDGNWKICVANPVKDFEGATLPNALADMIIWLVDNKHLTFKK